MDVRLERGRAIASTAKIRGKNGSWLVPSQSSKGRGYVVSFTGDEYTCTCPDYQHRHSNPKSGYCKHIYAVMVVITTEVKTEVAPDGTKTVTEKKTVTVTKRTTYKQVWPAYNKAQTEEKGTFQRLLADLCAGIPQPEHTKGRRPVPMADMVFAGAFKVYSTFSGRRFMTDMNEAYAKGYVTRAPHYNTIFKYLEMPELTPLLKELVTTSSLPLAAIERNFAVDSTGFSTTKFTRWYDHKWGEVKEKHDWKKVHAMVGVDTQIVTAVEVTGAFGADTTQFIPLVNKTAENFTLDDVSADKAYSNRLNLLAVWEKNAYPFVPFKSNTSNLGSRKGTWLWRKLFHFYSFERETFNAHYHQRSNVETAFSMMKRKFGDALRSKTETAQFNEALLKVLCHNICCVIQSMHELGITADFGPLKAA